MVERLKRRAKVTAEPTTEDAQNGARESFIENSIGYLLKRAQVRSDSLLDQFLGDGLSPARLAALTMIGETPGISQNELGAKLGIAGPSVVKVIDRLEALNLVERRRTDDRRSYALWVSKSGHVELKRGVNALKAVEGTLTSKLDAAERKALHGILRRIVDE